MTRQAPHEIQYSCHHAYKKINTSTVPQVDGLRELYYRNVQVPQKYLSDDGRYAFDVSLVETLTENGDVSNRFGVV